MLTFISLPILTRAFFAVLLTVTLATGLANQEQVDMDRLLNSDIQDLRGQLGVLFEPDPNRGESRTALRHILMFLNKRPGAIKPAVPETEDVCGEVEADSQWNAGNTGYSTKSLLPAIIASMKEDALYNFF